MKHYLVQLRGINNGEIIRTKVLGPEAGALTRRNTATEMAQELGSEWDVYAVEIQIDDLGKELVLNKYNF